MRLTLERMALDNFKGVRHLELAFGADGAEIKGANGTGKTTIVDAFTWVLFNQSASGDAPGSDKFREKPLDEHGEVIHNLDTTVALDCLLDGQRFDLKRTQRENWVKKRGNAEAVFQGNVSTYWINGVETKQQDFRDRISAIADCEIMRLVGSLSAFNLLDWKNRRAQLLTLAGNDVDSELLARDEYRPIADEIARRNISPDELKKVLADQRKVIGKELQLLPVRIDEAKASMPQITAAEIRDAEYLIEDCKKTIASCEQQIIEARAASGEGAARAQIMALEQAVVNRKRQIIDEYEAGKRKVSAESEAASENFRRLSAMLGDAKREAELRGNRVDAAEKQVQALRDQYMMTKRQQVAVSDTCPTCGQPLPAERVDEIKRAAEASRRSELLTLAERGKQAAAEVDRLKQARDEAEQNAAELDTRVQAAQKARDAALAAVKDFPTEPDFAADKALSEAYNALNEARASQAGDPDEKVRELTERKRELLAKIDEKNRVLAQRDIMEDTKKRIEMHEARQRELGAQYSEAEILTGLTERFIQDRCGALEDSINSHFPTVRWKLFDTQINGGIVDTCVCMIDCDGALVPYESANTASQIAADIEIVDVLSDHYDIRVPLFVDNAERVNRLPHIDSQTITLSVSTDSELNIKEA